MMKQGSPIILERSFLYNRRRFFSSAIMGLFVSATQTIAYEFNSGYSFPYSNTSFNRFLEIAQIGIAWWMIGTALSFLLFAGLDYGQGRINSNHSGCKLPRRAFWKVFVLYLLCWLPYLVIFFPGISPGDTTRQIMMFFHLPTRVAGRICTDGIDILYSAHHPLFLTFVFGSFYWIGVKLGNVLIGQLLYTIIQMAVCSLVYTFAIQELYFYGVRKRILCLVFLWTALHPGVNIHHVSMFSDEVFSLIFIVVSLLLARIVYSAGECLKKGSFCLYLFLGTLFLSLSKKPGWYLAAVTLFVFALVYKRKELFAVMALLILSFNVGFEGILYDRLNVSPSGIQEMLSVPFQQTARFMRDYPGNIPEEEYQVIDRVLRAEIIAKNYDPNRADNVKGQFRQGVTNPQLQAYFKVWLKEFFDAPSIYFASFFNGTYRYFDLKPGGVGWGFYDTYSVQRFFDAYAGLADRYNITEEDYKEIVLESPQNLRYARNSVKVLIRNLSQVPLFGSLLTIGFYFLLTFSAAVYLLYSRRAKEILILIPSFLLICVCLISPVNGSVRYALPVICTIPYTLAILISPAAVAKARSHGRRKPEDVT